MSELFVWFILLVFIWVRWALFSHGLKTSVMKCIYLGLLCLEVGFSLLKNFDIENYGILLFWRICPTSQSFLFQGVSC